MANMNCATNRARPRAALLRVLLGLALLLPTALCAGGHTIRVQRPNGVDDTANIQAALNAAVAKGPGATVQLAAGKYLTQQLATYNFHGTFKGMGKDKTTLEALPNLWVDPLLNFWSSPCLPNGGANRWPSLIIFVDGQIRVAGLSIKISAAPGTATTPWNFGGSWCTFLLDAIRIMGTTTTSACVDGVSIEGRPDDSATSWGFNVVNGVDFVGELPISSADLDYYVLSGDFTVRNSSFKTLGCGAYVGGFVRDSKVVIGGSPSAGNVFENVWVGMDMEGQENSRFEISYNKSEGMWNSMWVIPWIGIVPAKPAHYSIHDNTFITTGPYADGIFLMDDPVKPWIQARIYNNTIELKNDFMWAGIGAYNTRGTVLWNNTISGTGAAAIQLGGDQGIDTRCTVIGNHLRGFFPDPAFGLAQIHLGPATSHNLVVCADPLDVVLDQGTENKVIGGFQQNSTSAEGLALKPDLATPMARPIRPGMKPFRRR
jgi:hypothetical protein